MNGENFDTIKKEMNMNRLIYIEYDRRSSEAKEKQALSLPDQRAECKKVEARDRLNVKYRFAESRSAFKPHNREDFDNAIKLIKEGKANAFLCWKEDRLCRNPEEGGILLQLLQDGILKEIRTVSGGTHTPDSDHLILQIHFGMANQYSRNLSQSVIRGLNHKCERGEYPRPAPIGYEGYGERGQRKIQPHPVEASLIIKAFELAASGGLSLSQICEQLKQSGLRNKQGKVMGKSQLHQILSRPTYYGYFYQNGELFEGTYEPLIKKALFDQVQEALRNRSKPKVKVWIHTYNGLITCGDCGCQITTTIKEKYYKRTDRTAVYTYHNCTHRRGNCSQKAVTGKKLERLLSNQITKIEIDQETFDLGIKLFKAKHGEEMNKLSKRHRYLDNQYVAIQKKLKAIVDMRADGELTKEEFLEQKKELLGERKSTEEKLNDNQLSADSWLELCTKYLNNAFQAREIMESDVMEDKRNLILDVGQNLILEDKKLQFSFKQPYDVLLLPKYRKDVLPSRDSNPNNNLQRVASYR